MISKHIRMRSSRKSSIVRLVEYITSDQGKAHRKGEVFIANCHTDDPDLAAREMRITQAKNRRAQSDKTYHLMVSFRPGEEPTTDVLCKVEADLCKALGYSKHQRITVVHRDTDSVHMHIAINKIHPTRHTIHGPFMDYESLARQCARLEKSLYLQPDNHTPTGKTKTQRQAQDIEAVTGQESLVTYIRDRLPALKSAKSWEEFHGELAKVGLSIKIQANGVNFVSDNGVHVKGSGIDREFSKANLEKRFGEFRTAPDECKKILSNESYQRKPLGPTTALSEEFTQARIHAQADRGDRLRHVRYSYSRRMAALLAKTRGQRKKARRLRAGRTAKRNLYKSISALYRYEKQQIREETKRERNRAKDLTPSLNWLSWLQEQAMHGRPEALDALRNRSDSMRKAGNALRPDDEAQIIPGNSRSDILPVDHITKHGTVAYTHGKDAIRDDGHSIRTDRQAALAVVAAALKIAAQRYGNPLQVQGDQSFRLALVEAAVEGEIGVRFADTMLENKRKQLVFHRSAQNTQHLNPTKQQRNDHER